MLQLVLGRAGTGKTTYIQQQLCQAAGEGKHCILLVPEQFSFESERSIYRVLGISGMANVEVLSFTRLSESIFRRYGGLAGRRLDETSRLVLMSLALDQVGDRLELYRRPMQNSSFLTTLVEVTTEFKNAGASPEDVEKAAKMADDPALVQKLQELSLIYGAFQALVERSFSDPLDDINRASQLAEEHQFFADTHVYIDSFMSFTAAEHRMLGAIIRDAITVTAAFCTPNLARGQRPGVFTPASKTALRLLRQARQLNVPVRPTVTLAQPVGFQKPGPVSVEAIAGGNPPPEQNADGVVIAKAGVPYDEVEYAAAQICNLVREHGLRYREMVVLVRDMERYRSAVQSVFGRYGIPYFSDERVELETQPIPIALIGALEAVRGSYKTDEILRLAKSPAIGLDPAAVAQLENYCYIWSVQGKDWEAPFCNNPRGMSGNLSKQDEALLEELNQTRERLMQPLARLRVGLRGCNGQQFALAVYRYLEAVGCVENIRAFCDTLPPEEEKAQLDLNSAIWDSLMALLDVLAHTLGGAQYPLSRFIDLLRLAISSVDIGLIPRTTDQVMVGAADRVRLGRPKAAFVLGVNEGIFPPPVKPGGVFSDAERERLALAGLELSQPGLLRSLEERYFLYTALCCPSEYLFVTYAGAEPQGRKLEPSLMLARLMARLPQAVTSTATLGEVERIVNPATALEQLARSYRRADATAAAIGAYLAQSGDPYLSARLQNLGRLPLIEKLSPHNAQSLFGREMRLSPSRLEQYYNCPFRYFCRYGLGVQPLKKAEFSPLESGTVIHHVLETIISRHGSKALAHLDEQALREEIIQIIKEYLSTVVAETDTLPARTKYLFERLVGVLVVVLQQLGAEFAQSAFEPVGFEVQVGGEGPVAPLKVQTTAGATVTVEGKIDRVDMMEDGQERYVRVVDYKSGQKKFRLSDLYYGLNMQMLLYLVAVCEGGQGNLAACNPAGILYMPSRIKPLSLPRETDEEQVQLKQQSTLQMNGLLLNDRRVLEGMEQELKGKFIPTKGESSLATTQELEQIRAHVKQLVGEMADNLCEGKITPHPVAEGQNKPCDYCDYSMLCDIKHTNRFREMVALSREEFFASLTEKGGEEDGN